MAKIELQKIKLTGISLKNKTTNRNGQSNIDCGSLWQKFETGKYADKIPGKLNDEILAVYHDYDGDYTQPFSYFIGCRVKTQAEVPEGMDYLVIPGGSYKKFTAKGKIPDCIVNTWKEIWSSDMLRAYQFDFEIYDERSKDWNNAEVSIFISSK
jgi:predicted transcriptional regulator YdeE